VLFRGTGTAAGAVFQEGCGEMPDKLGVAAAKPLAWNEVAGELKRYALVQRIPITSVDRAWKACGQGGEGAITELALTVHRLTQQVVRDQLAESQQEEAMLLHLLTRACRDDASNAKQWPRLAALLPHAVWVNDVGVAGACDALDSTRKRTRLLDRAAAFLLFGLALYPQARARLEQVLAVRRQVLGEEQPDTLSSMSSMNGMANTLRAQGDLAGARSLGERALAIRRRVLGEGHTDLDEQFGQHTCGAGRPGGCAQLAGEDAGALLPSARRRAPGHVELDEQPLAPAMEFGRARRRGCADDSSRRWPDAKAGCRPPSSTRIIGVARALAGRTLIKPDAGACQELCV
jgi:Tetratricopeptide repeat